LKFSLSIIFQAFHKRCQLTGLAQVAMNAI